MLKEIIFCIALISICACRDNITTPTEIPDTNEQSHTGVLLNTAPILTDPIPFDKLGSGKIAFQRISTGDTMYEGVYVIDINSKKSWVVNLPYTMDGCQISPEGDKIAFPYAKQLTYPPTENGFSWGISITDIYGNNFQRISENIEGIVKCPAWLPDNQEIIYYSNCVDVDSTHNYAPLFISDINTNSTKEILDIGKTSYPYFYVDCINFSVSSRGVCVTNLKGISAFDEDGNNFKTIVNKYSDDFGYFCPVWNPEGNKIAVLREGYLETSIILFNQDGKDSTRIFTSQNTGGPYLLYHTNLYPLCWSPDGSKILFNMWDLDGYTAHIYLINADGSNLTKVTSLSKAADISLSWGK